MGHLHDPVLWYKITQAGTQVPQWHFQNKGTSRWTGTSCFVLRPSMCDFVPCDRVVQRAYLDQKVESKGRKLKLTEVQKDEIKCRS